MPVDTLQNAHAQYLENCDYDATQSTAKATLFVQACRALLLMQPDESRNAADSVRFNTANIAKELERATAWLARRQTGGSGRVRKMVRCVR